MKAHVDLATGKIHGCKEYSWKWYHEKGHIIYNANPKTSWLLMFKSYVHDLWMIFVMGAIIYRPILFFGISFWGIYTFITLHEELWCNKYAKLNYKGVK